MKKWIAIIAVVLVVALGAGPWHLGRVAHSRLDEGLDALVEKVPYIRIVERKWSGGWFRSESTVTFEFVVPGLSKPPIAALADAAPVPELLPEDEPAEEVPEEAPADGEAPVEEPSAQAIPKFPMLPPMRFSVRSDVLHGPVLGAAGIGLARLDSKIVISEQVRSKLLELLGTDEPVRIRTRMAFLGGGTTTLSGDARTIPLEKLGAKGARGSFAWDDFELAIGMSRGGKSYDVSGSQPRIEFKSEDGKEHVLFTDLGIEGKGSRVTDDLYDGKVGFGLGRITIASSRSPPVEVDDIHYDVESISKGDYFDYGIRMGSGAVKSSALESLKFELKEVHYDMTVRHLHTPTLQKLTRALRDSYSSVLANPVAGEMALIAPLAEHGRELLKHDPVFVIDRIGIVTAQGEAAFRGTISLPGVTDEDLNAGPMSLVPKIVADITFEAPQALFDNVPNGNMITGMGVDQGFLERKGGKLTSHIEFKGGKLTVNGKSPQIPPLFGGGQAPAAEPSDPAQRDVPPEAGE